MTTNRATRTPGKSSRKTWGKWCCTCCAPRSRRCLRRSKCGQPCLRNAEAAGHIKTVRPRLPCGAAPDTEGEEQALRVFADLHAPHLRTFLEVLPGDGTGPFHLELVVERFRIVVIDEFEGGTRLQFIERLEKQRVAFPRWN